MPKIDILVVDDEQEMLKNYEKILGKAGHKVQTVTRATEALKLLKGEHRFSLIICDLKMPEMNGITFLEKVKLQHPYIPIIMVTGYGTLESGIEAVKKGAFDFIEKPFSSRKLLKSVQDALGQISPIFVQEENGVGFDNMVGNSPSMKKIFELIPKVSYGNASVLITGESGVGKELVARSIHKHSLRRNRPLIPINCGAFPENLFESELFGYEKGAFTGAFQSKPGLIELANGGTLFLDEVCEMPVSLQVKLLRVLEEKKIRRIGGKAETPVDVRIISATNRDVENLLKRGILREDFFFRINTIHIHVPPIRERVEDIPLLIHHFLKELNQRYDRQIVDVEPAAMEILKEYDWPGNIRELQNVIERTYYLANPPLIKTSDLPSNLQKRENSQFHKGWTNLSYKEAKELVLEEFEKEYLSFQLKKYQWNISKTAQACGIDRRTIHRLIKRFNLKREEPNE